MAGWAGESSRCEDPAPTVGVCGDAIASQMPPIVATMRMPCRYVFYHDAARRVATVFEKWNFLIETYLRKKGKSPQKIESIRAFRRGFFLEYDGLKPILPFLGGRSDAACRVVIRPSRLPPMGAYGLYHAPLVREGTRSARHLPYRDPH